MSQPNGQLNQYTKKKTTWTTAHNLYYVLCTNQTRIGRKKMKETVTWGLALSSWICHFCSPERSYPRNISRSRERKLLFIPDRRTDRLEEEERGSSELDWIDWLHSSWHARFLFPYSISKAVTSFDLIYNIQRLCFIAADSSYKKGGKKLKKKPWQRAAEPMRDREWISLNTLAKLHKYNDKALTIAARFWGCRTSHCIR